MPAEKARGPLFVVNRAIGHEIGSAPRLPHSGRRNPPPSETTPSALSRIHWDFWLKALTDL